MSLYHAISISKMGMRMALKIGSNGACKHDVDLMHSCNNVSPEILSGICTVMKRIKAMLFSAIDVIYSQDLEARKSNKSAFL